MMAMFDMECRGTGRREGDLVRKMDSRLRERYSRQILFADIGETGQERLSASSAALVGCGALGTALANLLVRAGLGKLRIVDRDFVEESNLQRQTLFEEADAREALPKAVAAERRLIAVNSEAKIEGVVADLTSANVHDLLGNFPLLLDGTDNFETRLLINDYAVSRSVPWVYAAVVGSYGVTMTVRPGETACLACLAEPGGIPFNSTEDSSELDDAAETPEMRLDGVIHENVAAGSELTCDTAGVLGAAAGAIACMEATAAIKLLLGKFKARDDRLVSYDVWSGHFQAIRVARRPDCRACGRREFRYLQGEAQPHLTMCGRDSVQIHEMRRRLDLSSLGRTLAAGGHEVRHNEFLLRFRVPPCELTVFADGRAIVKGTRDPAVARSLYARYIGS
jgi:molybdopterin/thiamine biosynthesis adenylyltransferase